MESMVFQVSAKTARLIGRENISDVDGAIIELVKNGYDADADCVYVEYVNPFNEPPTQLTRKQVQAYFEDHMDLISQNYRIEDGIYKLNKEHADLDDLEQYLRSLSQIIVMDNGTGMSKEILKTAWMNIGTDNKEVNVYSSRKNRIKTGAKGIGRFALDKLSLRTQVFTKCADEVVYRWEIDWTQFDSARLLNQVNAELQEEQGEFEGYVEHYVGADSALLKEYDWSTGTIIVLSPIREFWDRKLYVKVNNNLKNLNPLGSVDRFDIYVKNQEQPELDFQTQSEGITRDNYDYMIEAAFDGKETVALTLDRNEIDISRKCMQIKYSPTDIETYDLDEFWNREAFKKKNYTREKFDGVLKLEYSLNEILENPKEELARYRSVGPFTVRMYYLKNQKSTVAIVKDFKSRKRRQLLKDFSGIKIYRDQFKVRPYGDEGQFFDWIDLNGRVQRSPAAASHETGIWRVASNQLIGSVSISRMDNPKLMDTANREGMSLNREYDCFVEILQGIISRFENDRQYPLREYAAWERNKKKAHTDKVQKVYEEVVLQRQKEAREKSEEAVDEPIDSEDTYNNISRRDLEDAVVALGQKDDQETSTKQVMMVLSSAGVMAQTFAHEITRIGTELGSRGQHLKESINRILDYQPYMGDEDFNPYTLLDELDGTDELLSEWVNLIMDSVKQESLRSKDIDVKDFLAHIERLWQPLLDKKYIMIQQVRMDETVTLRLPEIDLHLILNNFILNSAYYLEEADGERLIFFSLYQDEKKIYLDLSNNGPELDKRYWKNPDETLNARVSSKKGGTGLGQWIAREAVDRNAGELHVIHITDGYMLQATWIK